MLFGIRMGATQFLHTRFDPQAALQEISAQKVTVFPGVPTMYTAINHFSRRRTVRPALAEVLRLGRCARCRSRCTSASCSSPGAPWPKAGA